MTTLTVAIVTAWAACSATLGIYGLHRMHRDAREREAQRVIDGIAAIAEPKPMPPAVAPSPLLRRRHRAAGVATTRPGYVGRHNLVGQRDPLLSALLEPTQTFAALAESLTGRTLAEVGPREADIRGVRTEGWQQPALPVEVGR